MSMCVVIAKGGRRLITLCLIGFWLGFAPAGRAAEEPIYVESLTNGWEAWGWATINYNNGVPVRSGSKSISVSMNSGWQAIYWHRAKFDSSGYTNLVFWIHGGTAGGQKLQVNALLNSSAQPGVTLAPPAANTWEKRTISLQALGVANTTELDGFWIQSTVGTAQPVFYLDDVALETATNGPVADVLLANITVDTSTGRKPINPGIYGVAFASSNQLKELNAPLNRWGGNSTTRYNWWLNADNKANDWYYQSIGHTSAQPGAEADKFIAESLKGGASPMMTIPMLDWMPKLGAGRSKLWSYSIAKYGTQTDRDSQWAPDAGNGILASNGLPITWNDPNDANFLTNAGFQEAWVTHLTNRWGTSAQGGVRYYILDNEHSLWHSTHRDIHPVGASMGEVRDRFIERASLIKAVDPGALIVGFEEWGWSGYFYSGADQQWSATNRNWNPANFPDRKANGGMDYMPWLLKELRAHEQRTGQRLLDVFTTHIYPQGGEFGNDVSAAMQATRNRSTRQLWDTNYVDPTWIAQAVKLIHRMRAWVDAHYPGLPLGITEYNWGAENHISGATAQADILGIFGREGLDMANRWTTPASTTPAFKAMKLFRNYDGNNSGFGDVSVSTRVDLNPDFLSAIGAVRTHDNKLTIVVVNKQAHKPAEARVSIAPWKPAGPAQVWQLTSANTISRLADVAVAGQAFTNTVPAQSVTLYVLAGEATLSPPLLKALPATRRGMFSFTISGPKGTRYEVVGSGDALTWTSAKIGVIESEPETIEMPLDGAQRFFRARWLP